MLYYSVSVHRIRHSTSIFELDASTGSIGSHDCDILPPRSASEHVMGNQQVSGHEALEKLVDVVHVTYHFHLVK